MTMWILFVLSSVKWQVNLRNEVVVCPIYKRMLKIYQRSQKKINSVWLDFKKHSKPRPFKPRLYTVLGTQHYGYITNLSKLPKLSNKEQSLVNMIGDYQVLLAM